MEDALRLRVYFFRSRIGSEPVREWLLDLDRADRKAIGEDIKTVQFGWPLGMPLVRKVEPGLWEVRSRLVGRIARVIFTVDDQVMVRLHGFIKKSQKIPAAELNTARIRFAQYKEQA
jgi:phage-related protein